MTTVYLLCSEEQELLYVGIAVVKGRCQPCYMWQRRNGKPRSKRQEWHSAAALM